jgi:diaminohydroxyphosphoribosylaminopyrimidine deaminase/5-amino-6-(5-phosphoribosylamino)uracil reductase
MASTAEVAAMRRAVELAARGARTTRPNPDVGAVVLDAAEHPVGEGWHERPGGPHAEVVALAAAGERARGGTAVVTLEPCAHTGRTGPCVEALLAAGVRRVVYAVADPTPQAAGGADRLRASGVDVEEGVLAEEAQRVNARWLVAVRLGRPYVVWKYAASMDGKVAAADGSSRWITGPLARADVHQLRAASDCIVVGVGTVLADDPQLTVRASSSANGAGPGALTPGAQPLRVVVDSHRRTPPGARVCDEAAPTWVATAREVGTGQDGRVDLVALLRRLHGRGAQQVLLEGGPTLAGSFLAAGLVDRVVGYVAPALLGDGGRSALVGAGAGSIGDAWWLQLEDVARIGDDVRITARPVAREA